MPAKVSIRFSGLFQLLKNLCICGLAINCLRLECVCMAPMCHSMCPLQCALPSLVPSVQASDPLLSLSRITHLRKMNELHVFCTSETGPSDLLRTCKVNALLNGPTGSMNYTPNLPNTSSHPHPPINCTAYPSV